MANRWTEGQPAIDQANRARQDQLALEKMFLTKSWSTRFQTTIFGIQAVNIFNGWTRVLGPKGSLKPTLNQLGMSLIRLGRQRMRAVRRDDDVPRRGRPSLVDHTPPRLSRETCPTAGETGNLPPRASPMRHILQLYSAAGKKTNSRRGVWCAASTRRTSVRRAGRGSLSIRRKRGEVHHSTASSATASTRRSTMPLKPVRGASVSNEAL